MPNITTFLDNRTIATPQKKALINPTTGDSYTYQDLLSYVCRIGNGLKELGIKKGDRVAIYLDSSPEYLISYFAIWRIGAVVVPTNIVYHADELLHVMNDSGAVALICDSKSVDVLREISGKASSLMHVIMAGNGKKEKGCKDWNELIACNEELGPENCAYDELCQIQYTSGTTGRPKGAMLTHGGWMAALEAEAEALELVSDDIYLGIYPMGHVGLSWGIAVLRTGGTFVIMERFEMGRYLELIQDYRITQLSSMPPVIHRIVDLPAGTEDMLKTVKRIISGGGPMHSPTWRRFNERFMIPIINSYGLSETIVLGTGTAIRPYHYPEADQYNSVGTPSGYSEVKIVDESNPSKQLPKENAGEIALRGPAVALGYWNRPKETADVFLPDGWFLTGDIGYIDKNGMLVITDRKKDMIIMSGWKIYPTEVEAVLVQHPKIAEVAVFGCDDPEKSEIPVAAVVLESSVDEFSHDELVDYAKERLAGYKIPRKTFIVDVLPRMGGWKLLRRSLRDKLCN